MTKQAATDGLAIVEYQCEDGTPFPVRFVEAGDAERSWRLEREHYRGCNTPLADAVARISKPGDRRAYTEAGLPYPSMWREGPHANGWQYFHASMPEGDELAAFTSGCAALIEKWGTTLSIWRDFSLPLVKESCSSMQEAAVDTPFAVLAERWGYAQHHTMVSAFVAGNDMRLVTAAITEIFGEDSWFVAHELSQGYENETLLADQQLWQLAQAVAADAKLRSAVAADEPKQALAALREAGSHDAFFVEFDRFLDEYGWRSESWCIDDPTWHEQGPGFWAQLRQMGRAGVVSPEEATRRGRERREALIAEIDEKLRGDEDRRAKFHRRVERLASYVPVREERALWQLVAEGSLRHAVMRRGEHLVDRGILGAREDVLYLVPAEFDDPPADARAVVAERRADHARWKALRPPLFIGAIPEETQAPVAPAETLRGVAASRGTARGPARVVRDLSDADRMEPGDVLVCQMTAPPWTPLFALAAAVVTDAGDIGSHPSIAAREYGIPCVVGAQRATEVIRDGDVIIVDGTAGTVQIGGDSA